MFNYNFNLLQSQRFNEIEIMDIGLKDRHILITGSAGSIGSATAKLLVSQGVKVTLHYHKQLIDQSIFTEEEKKNIFVVQADLTKEEEISSMFQQAVASFGRIYGLVNNAGTRPKEPKLIKDIDLERWNNTLQTNLTGYFLCLKYFFKNLENNPGDEASVVFISSTAGVFGESYFCDYATSKSLTGFMLTAKNEIVYLARKGRVNIVAPGWTITPRVQGNLTDTSVLKVLQTIPMRKIANVQDMASQILVLLSPVLSGHVSGQQIVVAGGMEGRVLFQPEEIDLSKKFG